MFLHLTLIAKYQLLFNTISNDTVLEKKRNGMQCNGFYCHVLRCLSKVQTNELYGQSKETKTLQNFGNMISSMIFYVSDLTNVP